MAPQRKIRHYVYRYNEINGQPTWQWKLEGTLVWSRESTEIEAIARMMVDAAQHDATEEIRDVSVIRPRKDGAE
jgi:hypothetical protein